MKMVERKLGRPPLLRVARGLLDPSLASAAAAAAEAYDSYDDHNDEADNEVAYEVWVVQVRSSEPQSKEGWRLSLQPSRSRQAAANRATLAFRIGTSFWGGGVRSQTVQILLRKSDSSE